HVQADRLGVDRVLRGTAFGGAADLHLVRTLPQPVDGLRRDLLQRNGGVPQLTGDRDVGSETTTAVTGVQRDERGFRSVDLVRVDRYPPLREGELNRHRNRRGHFFASLVSLGRVVPLEAEPVTHGVGSVTDGIARCLAGLSDRVGGIADSVHDTARIDAHVEADLATDAESDTQRGTQMELPIVTHAELGAGLDPGAGPGLTAHTGTDTGHLGTDLAGDSRPGEGLGSDVHTGQTDAAFRRR